MTSTSIACRRDPGLGYSGAIRQRTTRNPNGSAGKGSNPECQSRSLIPTDSAFAYGSDQSIDSCLGSDFLSPSSPGGRKESPLKRAANTGEKLASCKSKRCRRNKSATFGEGRAQLARVSKAPSFEVPKLCRTLPFYFFGLVSPNLESATYTFHVGAGRTSPPLRTKDPRDRLNRRRCFGPSCSDRGEPLTEAGTLPTWPST